MMMMMIMMTMIQYDVTNLMGIDGVIHESPVDCSKIQWQTNWPITAPLDGSIAKEGTPVKSQAYYNNEN